MPPAAFVWSSLSVALLGLTSACDGIRFEETRQVPVSPAWMEWPAEISPGTAFGVRIIGFLPSCGSDYVRRYRIDDANSVISFTPYAVVPGELPCTNVAAPIFVDSIVFTGLSEGTYDLRSTERVFGQILVRPNPGEIRLNAAGGASTELDEASCVRLRPSVMAFIRPLPLENPPNTTPIVGFVTGYIVDPASPLCGETRVFHLVTRE